MNNDDKKRGYLLPKGCKDLIDASMPMVKHQQRPTVRTIQLPPIIGEMTVADLMTVGELTDAMKQKPSKIIADFMELFDVSVNVHQMVYFHHIVLVIRLYGFTAKNAVQPNAPGNSR